MFEIDKKQFGAFVAELRKERGLTQKELAGQLFISDKAVSKWETGASIPDTALLIPLADLLGVSVTELLMCGKVAHKDPLDSDRVEDIVKTAITYAQDNPKRIYQFKSKSIILYLLSLFVGGIGILLNDVAKQPCFETLTTTVLLSAAFGAYFCCFVRTTLPTHYDENNTNIFYDGAFRMNMPGVRLNNNNWTHIVKVIQICMCCSMVIFPMLNFVIGNTISKVWIIIGNYVFLVVFFCVFFIPVYFVGKKYE